MKFLCVFCLFAYSVSSTVNENVAPVESRLTGDSRLNAMPWLWFFYAIGDIGSTNITASAGCDAAPICADRINFEYALCICFARLR